MFFESFFKKFFARACVPHLSRRRNAQYPKPSVARMPDTVQKLTVMKELMITHAIEKMIVSKAIIPKNRIVARNHFIFITSLSVI